MTKAERVRALIGNMKNWSWDVFPQFRVEKEDAEALQDLEALKEYIEEREKYGRQSIYNRQNKESAGEESTGNETRKTQSGAEK